MNSHIAVSIDGVFLTLKDDASIDLEDVNPYLNDEQESYSYSFSVPVRGNEAVLGDVADIQSDARLVALENKPMTVFVEGLAMRNGKVATTEDQDLKDEISISLTSNIKKLSDYISDLKCRDVPVIASDRDRLQIGEMIGNVHVDIQTSVLVHIDVHGKSGDTDTIQAHEKYSLDTELPALGFSQPYEIDDSGNRLRSFVNVTDAYPQSKFCNARVCYKHYKKSPDGTSSDAVDYSTTGENSTYNPYLVLEADRPSSGICFYVMYFLDCVFDFLSQYGIVYDNSELMTVDDFKRLCFFTTHCKYDLERKSGVSDSYDLDTADAVNAWLSRRKCGGQLSVGHEEYKEFNSFDLEDGTHVEKDGYFNGEKVHKIHVKPSLWKTGIKANIMKMYANSQNFPDDTVQTIIDSLWASFGIRFYVDQNTLTVRPFFIRNLLRDSHDPIVMDFFVEQAYKQSEKITGFRMKYSAESDSDEQRANVANGVRDYNTDYDYIDYHRINTQLTYGEIIRQGSTSNMTLYIDRKTGNMYRVKVDGEAENAAEYHPVIFQVGQFKGVEIGDCSTEVDDFVEEVESSFTPLVFNDVNGRYEMDCGQLTRTTFTDTTDPSKQYVLTSVNASNKEQVLAVLIDEDMWHEDIERKVQTIFGSPLTDFYLVETTKTKEAFDPSNSDDGQSPLQSSDWGISIALMRGGGTDAKLQLYDYNYDGFGNSKYRMVPGLYGIATDCIDAWGSEYDYNGELPGIGGNNGTPSENGRFSLQIRSYIEAPEDLPDQGVKKGDILCDPRFARRGLFDTFMAEYAYFLLHRKKVTLEGRCSAAWLMNIKWNKRYTIGGYTGLINKISTHITAKAGIDKVTIEMYVL